MTLKDEFMKWMDYAITTIDNSQSTLYTRNKYSTSRIRNMENIGKERRKAIIEVHNYELNGDDLKSVTVHSIYLPYHIPSISYPSLLDYGPGINQ